MKKFTHFMMAAALALASFGMVACGDDDEKDNGNTTYEESASYAIYYEGQALKAGQTIVVSPTAAQIDLDDVEADLFMYNKTDNTLNTCFKVELVDGPASMNEAPVCYGVCQSQQLPYTHEPISLAPGMDPKPIQVHVYMGLHEGAHTGTYRITVGEGTSLANPQVCNIKFNW